MGGIVKLIILIILPVIILLGCSTEGNIKIINRTQHNLYFSVKSNDYILEGATPEMLSEGKGNSRTISIDTGNKFLFTEPDGKKVKVDIEGETFSLPEDEITTELTVNPGETTKAYADPTHAGVKIINESELMVSTAYYFSNQDPIARLLVADLGTGESHYIRLLPSTDNTIIYYSFRIILEDQSELLFGGVGDENANLGVDDQFLITIY